MKRISIASLSFILGILLLSLGSVNACNIYCNTCADCTAKINAASPGQVICLTQDIKNFGGTCINNPDGFNNKVFDCQGNIIDGTVTGGYGIFLDRKINNTIRNCIITGFRYGIYLNYSSSNTLTNNTANKNSYGITLVSSSSNTLTNNTAKNNFGLYGREGRGIFLDYSSNNNLANNIVNNNNEYGIYLFYSSGNTLTSNIVNNNTILEGLRGWGIYLYFSSNNILTNNTANNNGNGICLTYFSNNNILTNNTANNNKYGIYFGYLSNNNTMILNNMCYNRYDVYDTYSEENLNSARGNNNTCVTSHNHDDDNSTGCKYTCPIDSCNCSTCGECSYKLSHSLCSQVNLITNITDLLGTCIDNPIGFNNKVFDCQRNTISGHGGGYGIFLDGKINNTIRNCVITNFYFGIYLHPSSNNTLINNTVNNNKVYGIFLHTSSNNTLINNTVNNNWIGIYFEYRSNNNTMISNKLCFNSKYDVYNEENMNSTTGKNNTCMTSYNYSEDNLTGCKYTCMIDSCNCSTCGECNYKLSHPLCSQINLTANILDHIGTCIDNPAGFNNKVFDCQGNTIDGTAAGGYGIFLDGKTNNTIRNCVITDFWYGIYLHSSSSNTLINNTANNNIMKWRGNRGYGIYLDSSSSNTLINNTANNNVYGIYFEYQSSNNTMISNKLCFNSKYDVYNEENMNSTTGKNNTCMTSYNYSEDNLTGCKYTCMIDSCNCSTCGECSYKLSHPLCSQVNLITNITDLLGTCIDNPIGFSNKVFDCQGNIIDGTVTGGYGIFLDRKINNTIRNCVITGFRYGIYLNSSSNNILANNTVNNIKKWWIDRRYGIYLSFASNNLLINNTVNNNCYGILFFTSNLNKIIYNIINNNTYCGVNFTSDSTNNTFFSNIVCTNELDIYDAGANFGDNNICNATYKWNDIGTKGCTYTCTILLTLQNNDADNDGIPNQWEIAYGLDPTNPNDALRDLDNDGLTNKQEYEFGTNLHVADTDRDGVLDGVEVKVGKDPLSPKDVSDSGTEKLVNTIIGIIIVIGIVIIIIVIYLKTRRSG